MSEAAPPAAGFHLMAKPSGAICNLGCSYCFYLEKEALYPKGERFRMSDAVLEAYIRGYIQAQPTPVVEFTWQGGEPTLMGLPFFKKAIELQRRYAGAKQVRNTLQTNGTLIDDAWADFLAQEGFLVGLSLDGPQALHDAHRVDKAGRSSFDAVVQGLKRLQKRQVQVNVLVTVSKEVSREPLAVYRFLKSLGVGFIQFNPVVERLPEAADAAAGLTFGEAPRLAERPSAGRAAPRMAPQSVEAGGYGGFLVGVYDEWVRQDVGKVHVMNFEWALAAWCQVPTGVCLFEARCGRAAIVEHDGAVYSCDHYMYPAHRLGDLTRDPLEALIASPQQQAFGAAKELALPKACRDCPYLFACHGECPKNRFAATADGEPGLNYLCPSYLKYFRHITPTMNAMAKLLEHGQAAALVMDAFKGPLAVILKDGDAVTRPRTI